MLSRDGRKEGGGVSVGGREGRGPLAATTPLLDSGGPFACNRAAIKAVV